MEAQHCGGPGQRGGYQTGDAVQSAARGVWGARTAGPAALGACLASGALVAPGVPPARYYSESYRRWLAGTVTGTDARTGSAGAAGGNRRHSLSEPRRPWW